MNQTALETGWETTTPATDTILRQFVHNHVDYVDAVAQAAGGRTAQTADSAAADLGRRQPARRAAIRLPAMAGPRPSIDLLTRFTLWEFPRAIG